MKFNNVILLTGIISFLFTGCATKISPKGLKTKEINAELKDTCLFIQNKQVSSSIKFGPMANKETVENEIKNITAESGGNAYFINNFVETSFGHYSSSFEIYSCSENKYVVSKQYKPLRELKKLFDEGIISKEEYKREKDIVLKSYQ